MGGSDLSCGTRPAVGAPRPITPLCRSCGHVGHCREIAARRGMRHEMRADRVTPMAARRPVRRRDPNRRKHRRARRPTDCCDPPRSRCRCCGANPMGRKRAGWRGSLRCDTPARTSRLHARDAVPAVTQRPRARAVGARRPMGLPPSTRRPTQRGQYRAMAPGQELLSPDGDCRASTVRVLACLLGRLGFEGYDPSW